MRIFLRWLLRLLLVLILAIMVVGIWKREEISRLYAVTTLYDPDKIVGNFSNMDAAFPNVPVPRGTGPASTLSDGMTWVPPAEVETWIKDRTVTALVVLKDGVLVYEKYFHGTSSSDRRMAFSVSKSYLSALVGILVEEGAIASLDAPVVTYAPLLMGGAYDKATIRDVLQMESGVTFDEDYLDFHSDINRMSRVLALGGEMDAFAADLTETFVEPGTQFQYVSIDTHVIGMVIRGATGRPVEELLSEKLIAPLGLDHEPFYLTDGVGTAFVLGGLNVSTRDNARFGQMFLQQGRYNGKQIIPATWVAASTEPSAKTAPGEYRYGLHWWIPKDGGTNEFLARGIYGQYIFVDKARRVVIAAHSADRLFREAGVDDGNIAVFRGIAQAISGE